MIRGSGKIGHLIIIWRKYFLLWTIYDTKVKYLEKVKKKYKYSTIIHFIEMLKKKSSINRLTLKKKNVKILILQKEKSDTLM